ncbi:hypothetical protein QWY99_14390 [Flavobacterium branchiarum]|uniref:Uncharacterized protein n=1 Tax=Flavobacterium branchiarum TaxID=1114870 RepID=A0ABV5FII5_9FLAO|nr:hypothetical protein [Flavobacterium branchiarum]MDN3674249.1 hypothetical protein [Flavobacterium branchiarum]
MKLLFFLEGIERPAEAPVTLLEKSNLLKSIVMQSGKKLTKNSIFTLIKTMKYEIN